MYNKEIIQYIIIYITHLFAIAVNFIHWLILFDRYSLCTALKSIE